jgi:hypothetical protein
MKTSVSANYSLAKLCRFRQYHGGTANYVSTLPPFQPRKDAHVSVRARMSDEQAETVFRKIRWASNNGDPFCPKCGCTIVYDCRRANGTARWRCEACPTQLLDHERNAASFAEDAALRVLAGHRDFL